MAKPRRLGPLADEQNGHPLNAGGGPQEQIHPFLGDQATDVSDGRRGLVDPEPRSYPRARLRVRSEPRGVDAHLGNDRERTAEARRAQDGSRAVGPGDSTRRTLEHRTPQRPERWGEPFDQVLPGEEDERDAPPRAEPGDLRSD